MHRLADHPSKGGSNFESRNEDSGGDREGRGEDGEDEGCQDVDTQGDEHGLGVGVPPVLHVGPLLHRHVGRVLGPGEVAEQSHHLLVRARVGRHEHA